MAVLSWSDLSGTAPGKKNTGGWTLRSSPWPVLWYIINQPFVQLKKHSVGPCWTYQSAPKMVHGPCLGAAWKRMGMGIPTTKWVDVAVDGCWWSSEAMKAKLRNCQLELQNGLYHVVSHVLSRRTIFQSLTRRLYLLSVSSRLLTLFFMAYICHVVEYKII